MYILLEQWIISFKPLPPPPSVFFQSLVPLKVLVNGPWYCWIKWKGRHITFGVLYFHLGIKYQQGMDTSLKTHLSFDSAIVHRPLLFYSLAKHHVHARFCIVNSVPAQSVRVYNDLMGQRTNTATRNWLTCVQRGELWDNSTLVVWLVHVCVAWLLYRIGYLATLLPVESMHRAYIDSMCFSQKIINSN